LEKERLRQGLELASALQTTETLEYIEESWGLQKSLDDFLREISVDLIDRVRANANLENLELNRLLMEKFQSLTSIDVRDFERVQPGVYRAVVVPHLVGTIRLRKSLNSEYRIE
jgi:hypothetical protein